MNSIATERAVAIAGLYLRAPIRWSSDDDGSHPVFVFDPPLTAAEQPVFDRLLRLAQALVVGITPAEWQALEPDIAGLQTYQGLASPTLAQTVQAVKAQSRILRAILKN